MISPHVKERYDFDLAGIARCATIIRKSLEQKTNLTDLERVHASAEIHPTLDKESLLRAGITASEPVLDLMMRYPREAWHRYLTLQKRIPEMGIPHPLLTISDQVIVVDPKLLDSFASAYGQIYWFARACTTPTEVLAIEADMWKQTHAHYEDRVAPARNQLAAPKVDLQRWVVRGVYDRTVLGIPQIGISVDSWSTDITLQGLSGKQRHQLLDRYRRTQDIFEFFDGVLFCCARDPLDTQERVFASLAEVKEMQSNEARELTRIALWLSGFTDGPETELPRAGIDQSDASFLLGVVRVGGLVNEDNAITNQDIVAHFLWRHKDDWESASGPSLFGFLGKCLKNACLHWVTDGILEGDEWIDQHGHAHKGKLKQELRSDQALDYLANRERYLVRSARKPDQSYYEGDASEQSVVDRFEEPAMAGGVGRGWRKLWLYNRPSSLNLGDFEKWIEPEIEVRRAFDQVYKVTTQRPVTAIQETSELSTDRPTIGGVGNGMSATPCASKSRPSPILNPYRQRAETKGVDASISIYQPNGFVRTGSKQAEQRAKRDAEVYMLRIFEDAADQDIADLSGLSRKQAAAAIKNISRNRLAIDRALKQGRASTRAWEGRRSTGGAFGVARANRPFPAPKRAFPHHSGPCIVLVRDGVKLDVPEILPATPEDLES